MAKDMSPTNLSGSVAASPRGGQVLGGRGVDKMLTQLRKLLLVLALAGCSTFACQPSTVTVANKRETARLQTVPGAMRTTETGRIEQDVRQSQIARDYWVQGREGTWYPVSADQFRTAQIGRELEICK